MDIISKYILVGRKFFCNQHFDDIPGSKIQGVNMGPICGRQGPGGPHVGPMNFAIWDVFVNI